MTTNNETPCKLCKFAIWSDITQIGCEANRLEIFRKAGIKILEAYDDEKAFYVVKNTCVMRRGLNFQGSVEDAREQLNLNYCAIVIANDSLKETIDTITSIMEQRRKPSFIVVIQPFDTGNQAAIRPLTNTLDKTGVRWKLENIINPDIKTIDRYIAHIQVRIKENFLAIFNAGYIVDTNLIYNIETAMVDRQEAVGVVLPDEDGNGYVVPMLVWKYYYLTGDQQKSVIENIKAENECSKAIHQIQNYLT